MINEYASSRTDGSGDYDGGGQPRSNPGPLAPPSEEWPHGATVKLEYTYESGAPGPIGWAKRDAEGHLVSAYSLLPLDESMWDVVEERSLVCGQEIAIATAKQMGITVQHETTIGLGSGYYSSYFRSYKVGPCPTEQAAWEQVLERYAFTKPGETVFTSREYGEVAYPNTQFSNGRLGTSVRRTRIEVRQIDGHFENFIVERLYRPGDEAYEPRDVTQTRDEYAGSPFKYSTVEAAKAAVRQYIGGYEEAESEARADSLAHHHAQCMTLGM